MQCGGNFDHGLLIKDTQHFINNSNMPKAATPAQLRETITPATHNCILHSHR